MPSKKQRAKAAKAAKAAAPTPSKALVGPAQDDLCRSKKADRRAVERVKRNYANGQDNVSTMPADRRNALADALLQGESGFMNHQASHRMQKIRTQHHLRNKLAARRGEVVDNDDMLTLAEKVMRDAHLAYDAA
jgi:hypothetical protein